MNTNWILFLIVGGTVVALLLLKQTSLIRPDQAKEWLAKGAKVIDVRGADEYQAGHLPGAINIPLGRLSDEIGRVAPDKNQPLLLHCLSGARSGLGKRSLKSMGYKNVFNLGSYSRAEQILTK